MLVFLRRRITRLIGDKGHDSDKLDAQLADAASSSSRPTALRFDAKGERLVRLAAGFAWEDL